MPATQPASLADPWDDRGGGHDGAADQRVDAAYQMDIPPPG